MLFSDRIHDWRFNCKICLPQKERPSGPCSKRRGELIIRARTFWNLTVPLNPNYNNPDVELLMPMLDQSNFNIIKNTLFDRKELHWALVYYVAEFILFVSKSVLEILLIMSKHFEGVLSWIFGNDLPFNEHAHYHFHYLALKRILSVSEVF